jgi:TRAP-type mannitol/chloroaromatic compound transport system permease small subunit
MAEIPTEDRLIIIDRIARRTGEVCSFLFLICMLIIGYEVIARYGFNAPTIWAHDLTISLCAIGFVMSGLYTLQRRAHIRITLVYDKLPHSVRRVLDVINGAIMLAFLGLLTFQVAKSAYKSVSIMETAGTASGIPIPAIAKSALLVACATMFILGAVQVARATLGREMAPEQDTDPDS